MKVLIIGGGTAGWITALSLYKDHNVTLVESDVPTIGVGESTTDYVVQWLKNKLDINDFFSKTNSTIKLGVQFDNWKDNDTYFHLFGDKEDLVPNNKFDNVVRYCYQNNINLDSLSIFEKSRSNLQQWDSTAMHWDSVKVPEYIKNFLGDKITYKYARVKEVNNFNKTINNIILDDNSILEADLYIDCTGFNRVLSKALGIKWNSWDSTGQVDTALVWQQPHTEELPLYTQSEAWDAGWRWKIPTKDRLGFGYVFDSSSINEEQATQEIRSRTNYQGPVRKVMFNTGVVEEQWINNLLHLGLSSHFIEPLEATNFDFLIFNLENLDKVLDNTLTKQQYNNQAVEFANSIRQFLKLHYLTGKQDTEFWSKQQTPHWLKDTLKNIAQGKPSPNSGPFTDYNWYKIAQGIGLRPIDKNSDSELLALYQIAVTQKD